MEGLYMTDCARKGRRRKKRERLLRAFLRLSATIFAVCIATMILVPLAYQERGEWAIGGEWMGVIFIAFIVFQLSGWILEEER